MAEVRYAVDTGRCTYLLDELGRCRSVSAPAGTAVPAPAQACVGAQFVASLDLRLEGGLSPELRVGGHALFVRPDQDGRLMLLRTALVVAVEVLEVPSPVADTRRAPPPVELRNVPVSRAEKPATSPSRTWPRGRPENLPTFPSYQGDEESLTILRPSYPTPQPRRAPPVPNPRPPSAPSPPVRGTGSSAPLRVPARPPPSRPAHGLPARPPPPPPPPRPIGGGPGQPPPGPPAGRPMPPPPRRGNGVGSRPRRR